MDNYSVIGKRIKNRDAVTKVTGKAVFAADIKLKGMLYGKILRSKAAHARILSIDVSEARQLKGVKAVITCEDTPLIKYSIHPLMADKLAFEDKKVRYIGDEIAAVAAVDEATAIKALSLIKVDLEELEGLFDPVEAMKEGAPKIHDHLETNVSKHFKMDCGDIEQGFARSDFIIEKTFTTHAQSHSSIETHACVADCGLDNQVTMWVNTQAPHPLKHRISQVLAIEPEKIRVIPPYIGGGFGSKIDLDTTHIACVLLSKKTGRPVKIINTREEQFTATRMRHPSITELKFGFNHDGTIVAKQARAIIDNGAYNSHGPSVMGYHNVMFSSLYRVENISYEGSLVYTNKNYGGACRGYGDPQATFAQETMMDMIAEKLDMDPIELRLKNSNHPDEKTANAVEITSCGLTETLEAVKKASNWSEKKKTKKKYRGLGVASMIYTGGGSRGSGFNYSGATMKMDASGTIFLNTGATDIGQGSNTTLTMIAAEILGMEPEQIRLITSDTDTTLPCMGTFGSRVTFCAGNAVSQAALNLKEKIIARAADILGEPVVRLEIKARNVCVAQEPEKGIAFSQIGAVSYSQKQEVLTGAGYYDGPEIAKDFDPKSYYAYPGPAMSFATHLAEVEVDPESGRVELINFYAAHDSGKVINPLLAEGQIEGGAVMGFGWALTEELKFENGRILNPNFHDYKLFSIKDIPQITPILVETIDPNGPFGAKGLGECAMVSTAPAILNAICDAVGVRICDLPATSEKVFNHIKLK
ncbi:MAG: molybdopterin-dependent oxidoreductase [Deltaproteobacteria bacterium]|uniref:xanthine dehydrogenase family protein molybdopterin-binding subunit n=1 Tax=Desulfobacula sp. TaxID=2593537 RepID=UPI00198589C5|nr:molybdopterin-dependent oxidoreductase [Candidatus Desulfobacula maris]MBL6993754.1 molybdopterin-dependent oxidoreductase [Desulfobacula sp.]